nr:cuticle-degrading protease [Quercus suber]
MRSLFSWLAALPIAALAAPVINSAQTASTIPNAWIVKFDESSVVSSLVSQISNTLGVEPKHTYDFGGFKGMALDGPDSILSILAAIPGIHYIERDNKVYANALVQQNDSPYGLGRISHRAKGTTAYVYDNTAGAGTYSYIIDTGILIEHPDFGGRATFGANFAGDNNNTDGNGHGTHVAGTTGSMTYGVAKKTNLIAVKVLGADGSGTSSGVIQGIQFAANDAKQKGRIGKAVANMSLGGVFSQATNAAVRAATDAGLFMAVAAGNDGGFAAFSSPASEASACTVGATDSSDKRASFSNFGSVVDIFAPGVDVLSTWNDGKTKIISGTSMATPHITGLGAYLLALEGARTPADLCARIQTLSTKNVITSPGFGSKNYLAYNGNGA